MPNKSFFFTGVNASWCKLQTSATLGLLHYDLQDLQVVEGFLRLFVRGRVFDALDDVHALLDAPKDGVLVVKPWRGHTGDEELRAIGVGARVCHAEGARAVVPKLAAELVLELAAPD